MPNYAFFDQINTVPSANGQIRSPVEEANINLRKQSDNYPENGRTSRVSIRHPNESYNTHEIHNKVTNENEIKNRPSLKRPT